MCIFHNFKSCLLCNYSSPTVNAFLTKCIKKISILNARLIFVLIPTFWQFPSCISNNCAAVDTLYCTINKILRKIRTSSGPQKIRNITYVFTINTYLVKNVSLILLPSYKLTPFFDKEHVLHTCMYYYVFFFLLSKVMQRSFGIFGWTFTLIVFET